MDNVNVLAILGEIDLKIEAMGVVVRENYPEIYRKYKIKVYSLFSEHMVSVYKKVVSDNCGCDSCLHNINIVKQQALDTLKSMSKENVFIDDIDCSPSAKSFLFDIQSEYFEEFGSFNA